MAEPSRTRLNEESLACGSRARGVCFLPPAFRLRTKAGKHESGIRYFEGGVAEGGADLL